MAVFVREKYAPPGAAAIVGAMSGESGINLDATVNRINADHGSGGIAEWRLDRKTKMVSFVHSLGKPSDDLEGQCLFVIYELGKDYPNLDAELRLGSRPGKDTVGFIATMCWNFVEVFERPQMALAHMDDIRVPQAIKTYNAYVAANHQTMPPAAQGSAGGAVVAGGGAITNYVQGGPAWASIVMALVSAAAGVISLFNVQATPKPLPVPDPGDEPVIVPMPLSPLDEVRKNKEAVRKAVAVYEESLNRLLSFAKTINDEIADLPNVVKTIEHEGKE